MMMDIVFRGKRVDNGRWVYGFYGHKPDRNEVEEHFIIEWEFNDTSDLVHTYFVHTPVIHETVGQYTGYNDKDDKWIFTGDIVESGTCVGVVVFEKGSFVVKSNGGYTHKAVILKQAVWQIIGNTTDNPELVVSYWKQNPFVRRASNKEG